MHSGYSSSAIIVTVRDEDCVDNIKKNLTTKGFGFNSTAMNPFAIVFKEEHMKFGQELLARFSNGRR